MKKLIIIFFCLFAVTVFAQQKKKSTAKAKTTVTTNKNRIVAATKKSIVTKDEYITCEVCYGNGKCPRCEGKGKIMCSNHDGYDYCDDDFYYDDEICAETCSKCKNYEPSFYKCRYTFCQSGKCFMCEGSGKMKNLKKN